MIRLIGMQTRHRTTLVIRRARLRRPAASDNDRLAPKAGTRPAQVGRPSRYWQSFTSNSFGYNSGWLRRSSIRWSDGLRPA